MNKTYNEDDWSETAPLYHNVRGIILLFTTTCAIIINGSVIFVFCCKDRKLLNRSNTYVCVISFMLFITNIIATPMVVISSFAKHWVFGQTGCIYYGFIMTFSGTAQILILTMFVVDRYILVEFYSLDENSMKHFTLMSIAGSYSAVLILSVFPFIGWNRYTYQGIGTSCSIDLTYDADDTGKSYQITLLVFCFAIPIIIMVFCLTRIFLKIRPMTTLQTQEESINETMQRYFMEFELAITFIGIIAMFLVTWTPYTVVLVLCTFTKLCPLRPALVTIAATIAKAASSFTILVYLRRNKPVMKAVRELYPWWRQITVQPRTQNQHNVDCSI